MGPASDYQCALEIREGLSDIAVAIREQTEWMKSVESTSPPEAVSVSRPKADPGQDTIRIINDVLSSAGRLAKSDWAMANMRYVPNNLFKDLKAAVDQLDKARIGDG